MKLTKEQIDAIVSEVAESRGEGFDVVKRNIGDAFNQELIGQAVVRAEVESLLLTDVEDARRYARFIPVDNNVDALPDTDLTRGFESYVGEAKDYAGTGGDIPIAEVLYGEQKIGFKRGTVGYRLTYDEVKLASKTGRNIEASKSGSARFAYETRLCNIAFFGRENGAKGLFNHDIPKVATANKSWFESNPQEIVRDIAEAISLAYNKSSKRRLPNTVILPESIMTLLGSTMTGINSDTSLLDYLKRTNILAQKGVAVEFESDYELETAGSDGGPRIVIYRKDRSSLEFLIAQELEFLEPQPRNLDVWVPGTFVDGGLWIKDENAIVYLDGAGE